MSCLISEDLSNFTKALSEGVRVDCSRTGEWYEEGLFMRLIRWLFGWEDDRLVRVANAFNKVLDQLEKIPVIFNGSATEMEQQKASFALHLEAAAAVKKQLEEMNTESCKESLKAQALRVTALKYRIEEANGGLSQEAVGSQKVIEEVRCLAEKWKQEYDLYTEKSLSHEESLIIEGISRYPEFVELLKDDPELSSIFFKWSLRDGCPVDAFVEFPEISSELKNGFMAGRVGRFSSQISLLHQKIKETGEFVKLGAAESLSPWEKHYTLPVEIQEGESLVVRNESVLEDDKVLNLNLNYKQTMREIIASIANRKREAGNIEMLGRRQLENGEWLGARLANYNSLEIAPYNPQSKEFEFVDLTAGNKEWWKSVPPLDTVKKSDLYKLYGIKDIKDGEWFAVVRSSREDTGLDVDKSHGYIDVLIPDGKGHYMIYPFGKFPAVWPVSFIEQALFITNTLPAKIQSPDENHYMPQRQQAKVVIPINEADGFELMDRIRKDLLQARTGNTVFQFPWENCGWWVQKLLEKLLGPEKYGGPIPNFFRTPLLDAAPKKQPLPLIFRVCRAFEGVMQVIVVKIIEFCLLAWRGTEVVEKNKKVMKTVMNSGHMKKLKIYHPSSLHERIKAGQVKSSQITMGNLHLVQASAAA